jgi:hypothetical protein
MSLRQFRRTEWNGDQMIARGALNLFPGELFVGLQTLMAVWTGEFEFTHKLMVFIFIASVVRFHGLQQYVRSLTAKRIKRLVKNA